MGYSLKIDVSLQSTVSRVRAEDAGKTVCFLKLPGVLTKGKHMGQHKL